MALLTFSLFVIYLVSASQAENSKVEVNTYAKSVISTGYEKKSIIEQLEDVSRVECSLQCTRKEGCKYMVVSESEKQCKLLKAVTMLKGNDPDVRLGDGEKIYNLFGKILCSFFTDNVILTL